MIGYHVTSKSNLDSIRRSGLVPREPSDMADECAIYLFPDILSLEVGVMNWLGDRFGDSEELTALAVDLGGLHTSREHFEIKCFERIEPIRISILTGLDL